MRETSPPFMFTPRRARSAGTLSSACWELRRTEEKARWVSPPFPLLLHQRFQSTWWLTQGHPGEKGQDGVSQRRSLPSFCTWSKSGSRRECGFSELPVASLLSRPGDTIACTCLESLRMPRRRGPRDAVCAGVVTPGDTSSAGVSALTHSHVLGTSLRSSS